MAGDTDAPANGIPANGPKHDRKTTINPYETDPDIIPKDDPFLARSAQYGRYMARDSDFRPRHDRWYEVDSEANSYWQEIVKASCTPENSLNIPGEREAFAAGSIVIRVDSEVVTDEAAAMFSCVNANELNAARKAEDVFRDMDVTVPVIYYCGIVDGKNVTVESRLPGVSLDVAWGYLTIEQVNMLKDQCRRVLERLGSAETAPEPSYVCRELNPHIPPGISASEKDILFKEPQEDESLCFVHNCMARSNIIVKDDRVVGLLDWRNSGFFGLQRASKVHRQFRGEHADGDSMWADIYEGVSCSQGGDQPTGDRSGTAAKVKSEPSQMNLDKVPLDENDEVKNELSQLDGSDLLEEHPTSKKIAGLRQGSASRASSSDRSSPPVSVKPGSSGRKSTTGATKKGTGRKTTGKKRKLDADEESIDSRRSNTPSSTRTSKAPAPKKHGPASLASSPAPEPPKKKGRRKSTKKSAEDDEDSDEDGGIFCICRKPDNHTWMIGCDGGCEDWFHGKCVNIDPRDAELIDKYICPNCHENGKGRTAWKPMCRLTECRKPARYLDKHRSKYCSDEHGREFMRQKAAYLNLDFDTGSQRRNPTAVNGSATPNGVAPNGHPSSEADDLGSRGGVITAADLKAVATGVSSVGEFRKLGARIVSPPPDEVEEDAATGTKTTRTKKLGLDADVDGLSYSPDEASKLDELRQKRTDLLHRQQMLETRNTFLALVRQRSKSVLERLKQSDPKGGWKDICGFDSRLAWSDEEFDEWRLSELGSNALAEGTPKALASSYPDDVIDQDGDVHMNGSKPDDNDLSSATRGVCTKKRCERHKQWVKVHQQELLFEEETLGQDLAKCEKEAQNVVERAVLRMWAEKDNAQVGGQ